MEDTIFQMYEGGNRSKKPSKTIPLQYVFDYIKNCRYFDEYDKIAQAKKVGNEKLKTELKSKLPFFLPSTFTNGNGRAYDDVVHFTGFLALDFDNVKNAAGFRDFIINEYSFILAAWLSASKKGVHALVPIPKVETVDDFKALFWGVANAHFDEYVEFDFSTQNAVLPMFFSPDYNIRINLDCELWTIRGENPKKIIPSVKPENIRHQIEVNGDRYKQWSLANAKTALDKITYNGHYQLRAAAYALGGHVGAGYLSYNEAESFLHNLIASHSYLSKGVKGYCTTASTMIMQGIESPIYINN
jgi:hypothetical protein